MKEYTTTKSTIFNVDGLKGQALVWLNGNAIAATMEHKPLLPLGAIQDEIDPSYYTIRNPTTKQMAVFLQNLANA